MEVAQKDAERHLEVTATGFDPNLFLRRLEHYAQRHHIPINTVPERCAALGLGTHTFTYYRLLKGQVPGLHKGIKIAEKLGLDVLDLWPFPDE